ncbi:MAG: HAMP domain-containing sensor histidine kinase [Deltaproteobacteria bacterium]
MLRSFLTANRAEIIEQCRARCTARTSPSSTYTDLESGVPLFLDVLARKLGERPDVPPGDDAATRHGGIMLRRGFTVGQVVHDYGDVCQTITQMAIDRHVAITTEDFKTLNMCLDEAIAHAVTEFGRQQRVDYEIAEIDRATEGLGHLAHELRNLIATATLAFDALKSGSVGVGGSTGGVLERSLESMTVLIDRSVAIVRLSAGVVSKERLAIGELMAEAEPSATMQATSRGHRLAIQVDDPTALIEGDRQIFASVISNLVQNACKFTHPHSQLVLRTATTHESVRIEVEDECGGLAPDAVETIFRPFKQDRSDRTGLGLGLSICMRGVEAMGGTLRVHDIAGKGCVFTIEFPRVGFAS